MLLIGSFLLRGFFLYSLLFRWLYYHKRRAVFRVQPNPGVWYSWRLLSGDRSHVRYQILPRRQCGAVRWLFSEVPWSRNQRGKHYMILFETCWNICEGVLLSFYCLDDLIKAFNNLLSLLICICTWQTEGACLKIAKPKSQVQLSRLSCDWWSYWGKG